MSIYWILTFVPASLIYTVLLIGLVGIFITTFITNLPIVKTYGLPIKIVSLILAAVGLYLSGALAYKHSMAVEVAELKERLAKAEVQSEKVNTVVVEKLLTEKQVIREKGKNIVQYVDREVTKYDDKCVIPEEVVNAHNMAASLKVDNTNE